MDEMNSRRQAFAWAFITKDVSLQNAIRKTLYASVQLVRGQSFEVKEAKKKAGCMMVVVATSDDAVFAKLKAEVPRLEREYAVDRVHLIRWTADAARLIRDSIHPYMAEDVLLFEVLRRAVVLVEAAGIDSAVLFDVARSASRLTHWDIFIFSQSDWLQTISRAVEAFCCLDNMTKKRAHDLVANGYFMCDDIIVGDPISLASILGASPEVVNAMISQAEEIFDE